VKAVLFASCATALYLCAVTLLFRLMPPRRRAAAMLTLFIATTPIFALAYVATPADLGLLPPFLTEPNWLVDLGFGLFVYAAGFFGGSLQLYNLAERGFSLRMMMDVVEAPATGLTLDDVRREYSHGHGIPWMFQKRIDDMLSGQLIAISDGDVVCLERGRRIARLAGWVRDFLRLEHHENQSASAGDAS